MSKILSKYAKTNNLTVEYTSQQDYMDALAQNKSPKTPADSTTPYTFQEWHGRNVGIISGEEYIQYNEYLKNWYKNRYTSSNTISYVRQDYISLLKQLSLVFKDEFNDTWMKDIDFDDNIELEDAIPFFARKLKEIAIYLVNKRAAIKKAKLKYNMAGAYNALERLFYEYLLKAFTKRDYILNINEQSAWNVYPDLSAVNNQFQIVVQELYDDTSYFDKDPRIAVSSYFNFNQPAITSYYIDTLNYQESALEWLFSTGINSIYADNPLIWSLSDLLSAYNVNNTSQLPLSSFESTDKKILNYYNQVKLARKYLGEDQYYVSGGYFILKTKDFKYEFQAGNNWFYWPSGEYIQEIENENWDPIALTATSLIDIASGSDNYRHADKIFVITDSGVSGAWLKLTQTNTLNQTMTAVIGNSNNFRFRFPYPGYGLSGEGLDWTGVELNNLNSTFIYLDKTTQEEILNKYWSTAQTVSTFNPISIHETKLINNGAYSDQYYQNADKIIVRNTSNDDKIHDTTPDSIYKGEFNRAWLYRPLKTDIPLKLEKNYIYWPLFRYEQGDTLPFNIVSSQCIPITLSSINIQTDIIGSRAGHDLYDSDIIYKLDSRDGYAVECAFLSGRDLNTLVPGATGKLQSSLVLNCKPGSYETFIWQNSTTNINNTTITHKEHQVDCGYINAKHTSIFNNRSKAVSEINENGIGNYRECTCKAIWYSPIGHPGNNFEEYDGMADIIFANTQFPSAFDIQTWVGTDGLPYNQSSDFAWFQLTGTNIENDVGWGRGNWKTGNGTYNFQLSSGIQYKYLRSNLKRTPSELFLKEAPELIIKQPYYNTLKPVWMKAALQQDGSWSKTNEISPMILNPGDYLIYDHATSNWYCLTSIGDYGYSHNYYASGAYPSPWSNFTFATVGTKIITMWPTTLYDAPSNLILAQELTSINWDIISPDGTINHVYEVSPSMAMSFVADMTGIYNIAATGFAPTRMFITSSFNNEIPYIEISARSLTLEPTGSLEITTIYNDQLNIIWNTSLTGWNYTTHDYHISALGGRPFWAKSYDDNSINTKYKGIDSWGRGIRPAGYDNYSYLTQPEPATLYLSSNCYVDYEYNGNNQIIWKEPIDFIVQNYKKQWNKLIINNNVVSPLSGYLNIINQEMIVSATDAESDLILCKNANNTQWINYWAMEPFTWTQKLTDTSIGIPPTGGSWIGTTTGLLIDAYLPYANLTNRHYPTIASIPDINGLYSTEDVGGYFIPRLMGISTYLGKNYTNVLASSQIALDNRGISGVYQDSNIYTTDNGLTQTTQLSLISTVSIDSSWMKANTTTGYKAGTIIKANNYQKFIPYQSRYETTQANHDGLQKIYHDPWNGTLDATWAEPDKYPANFRGEYPIDQWYDDNDNIPSNKFIYNWKTDIFGNQYVLLKDNTITSLYEKDNAFGELWVRDQRGYIQPAAIALSGIYNSFYLNSALSAELVNNQIRSIDVWFDTILFETPNYIVTQKIEFDYDTVQIYGIADNIRYINLTNRYYAGLWFFDTNKTVTICTLASANCMFSIYYPELYTLDLNTNDFVRDYNGYNNSQINQMSSLGLTSIEPPVFSYNSLTKQYNASFIGYSYKCNSFITCNISIANYPVDDRIINVDCIIPNNFNASAVLMFNITAEATGQCQLSPSGIIVIEQGEQQTFTVIPCAHYYIDWWYLDDAPLAYGVSSYTLSCINTNHHLVVDFTTDTFTITASAINAYISPSGVIVKNYNSTQVFNSTGIPGTLPNPITWYLDGNTTAVTTSSYNLTGIDGEHIITVEYQLIPEPVAVYSYAASGGSINPDGTSYVAYGDDLEFIATPDTQYHSICNWYLDGDLIQTGLSSYTLSSITLSHTVSVTFSYTPSQAIFIAGGYDSGGKNPLTYSYDGLNWFGSTNGPSLINAVNDLCTNGNKFIAVGNSLNRIIQSNDGITWYVSGDGNSKFASDAYCVCWNGSIFVAGGPAAVNTIIYSSDGETWTNSSNGNTIFDANCLGLCWGNNMFIAGGNSSNKLAYSYDGDTWVASTSGNAIFSGIGACYSICYNGSRFVAAGGGFSIANVLAYSDDGINWFASTNGNSFMSYCYGVCWNGSIFVAGGYGPNPIVYSSDGITWSGSVNGSSIFSNCKSICWNGSMFIAGGNTNALAYSYDGANWTLITDGNTLMHYSNAVISIPAPNLDPPIT